MEIMKKYLFSIPDSEIVRNMNFIFFEITKFHKDWCYDDYEIETAYGVPGGCIWNGNRETPRTEIGISDIKNIVEEYGKYAVKYRLTFTNFLLKTEHLHDKYANEIAFELNKQGGYCMIALPMMYDYMSKEYPNLLLSWSTTTDFGKNKEEKIVKINELSKNNLVVPSYDLNRTEFNKWKHPNNLEFLINEGCVDNCPKRREHEIVSCQYNLGELKDPFGLGCLLDFYGIKLKNGTHFDGIIGRRKLFEYAKHGINHFKISGRNSLLQSLGAYLYFMIYPERWLECLLAMHEYAKSYNSDFDGKSDLENLQDIIKVIADLEMLVREGGLTR